MKRKHTKVRFSKDRLVVQWSEDVTFEDEKVVTFKSEQAPHSDFLAALAALVQDVKEIIEAPAGWMKAVRVTGVAIKREKDGRRGVTITALRDLAGSNTPLAINTPYLREAAEEDADGNFLDEDTLGRIDDLCAAADAFIAGKREQRELELAAS